MAKKAARRKQPEAAVSAEVLPEQEEPAASPEPEKWKMPKPVRGQSVIFYRNCMISDRNSEIGFVAMVGESSISVSYQNQGADDCYHVDDPRLLNNPDIRSHIDGVWEFTKEKIEIEDRFRELEQRIKNLEG